ncbi:MAG: carboxypeptidase M32 [Myxococcales bacterium]|nr:carboxypeptidase M32 [Myxococcales bacterium]
MEVYRRLEERSRRLADLRGALAVLQWDRATVMPDGGAEARAEQIATLSGFVHRLQTEPEVAELLEAAEASQLDAWQAANLREMRRAWRHATAVSTDLVEAVSKCASEAEMTWRRARANDDFVSLAPKLAALVVLVREVAVARAAAFGVPAYDALLDQHDPGRSGDDVDARFAELEALLPGLLEAVLARQARRPAPRLPAGPFPRDRQRALGRKLMEILGFDFRHGRLDVSHHPFTGGVSDDVRITTRYVDDDFTPGLMAVIHETGHALYERGLPDAWRRQPVGCSQGMTLHESQSLLFEMQAGRSPEFIAFLAPLLREAFGGTGAAWETENLVRVYHRVARGCIRVEADEVTYPLHVILRYRLERALIADELRVADLPGAWRDGMRRLLGTTPVGDADGCLQDIHWPTGAFGYFPTYTLGALAAAQLFEAAKRAEPELLPALGRGEVGPLLGWLREKVHGCGSRYGSAELIERATGRPLGTEAFAAHLRARYLGG